MIRPAAPEKTLAHRWETLHQLKGDLLSRAEQYAKWTLPNIFPDNFESMANWEQQLSNDSIGARGANHLGNRVVSTLFRPQGPFFRLSLPESERTRIKNLASQSKNPEAEKELSDAYTQLEDQLASVEIDATEQLDMVEFRPQATNAAQLLIITGNALEYHPDDDKDKVQIYSLRDYCVVRDLNGTVIEIVTRDCKAFETFSPEVQEKLRGTKQYHPNQYEDLTKVTIYTQVRLEKDGKYHVKQAADLIDLEIAGGASYPSKTLPWIALTWKLQRGEDYGRGLVEDYAGAFHTIEVLTQSLINIAGVMGNLQFFVDPASMIDVAAVNAAPPGQYHAGRPDQIGTPVINKFNDAQFIKDMIDRYERQISAGFLLTSGTTRDAERVTAEEIRRDANELETSHGGIYSRLAYQWQLPVAYIILNKIGFDDSELGKKITPKIITGMDTLSRQGELDNWQMWVAGLALLEGVPEDVRAVINPSKFAAMVGRNTQVDYKSVLFTETELQQRQEAAMQQQQAMMQQQEQARAGGAVAAEAGKTAVQEG